MASKKPQETTHDLRGPMRELREYARGALDVPHSDVDRIAGLIEDDEVLDLLLFAAAEYKPVGDMPPTFWETEFAKEVIQNNATKIATKAIREGDQSVVSYLTGIPSYSRDVSGMDGADALEDYLLHSEPCKVIYLAALMGRGKTGFAVRCIQAVERHYRRAAKVAEETEGVDPSDVPVPEVATNFYIDVPEEARIDWKLIDNYPELEVWMEKGSHDDIRWFWFDEASTELTAQDGENAQMVVKKMGGMVKKMRKNGVDLGTIGHDRGDVHILIRAMADFIDKESLKEVTVYEGIKDRDPHNPMFSLRGIPDATWGYDTEDMADWEWGDAEEVPNDLEDEPTEIRNERVAMYYENVDTLTYDDLADVHGVDKSTISRWVKDGKQRLESGDSETYPSAATAGAD